MLCSALADQLSHKAAARAELWGAAGSHRKKRTRQIKKMMQRGLLDPEKEDPFSLFVASTNIRYCFYHDTHKILGNTFGMCVLQARSTGSRKPTFLC